MVEHPPRNRVARWVIQAGKRWQESRRAQGQRTKAFKRPRVRLSPRGATRIAQTLAWGVHLYTALGLIAAAVITILLVNGGPAAVRGAFVAMLVATLIDATDGTLARRAKVKQVLPGFDGRRLDDLIDFLNYTCLPLLLIWRAELIPGAWSLWLLWPLLASAYGFCQVSIKTDDGYFLGFPSLWNVVAFYLYMLRLHAAGTIGFLFLFGLLTFVPSRYLYPSSKPGIVNTLSNVLGCVWGVLLVSVLWWMPTTRAPVGTDLCLTLTWISLLYPAYYLSMSWWVSVKAWRVRRG